MDTKTDFSIYRQKSLINIPMNGADIIWTSRTFDLVAWPWPKIIYIKQTRIKGSFIWHCSKTLALNSTDKNMNYAHILDEMNIWLNFREYPSSRRCDMEQTIYWNLKHVTLISNQNGWDMGSAHCLDEVNNLLNFPENHSKCIGDMERTRN